MNFNIGEKTFIFLGCTFDVSGGLSIGKNCVVNSKCRLDSRGSLTIGNNVSISNNVIILTADHDMENNMSGRETPVMIDDYVWIGTKAMILPGVIIRKGAVVAAGSVVTKSVEQNSVVGGVPAKIIRVRANPSFNYSSSYKRLFQ